MTYWEELEAKAKELFDSTARGMGFLNHTPWEELAEETRDHYRREAVRRLSGNGSGATDANR